MRTRYKHRGSQTAAFWAETEIADRSVVVGTVWFLPLIGPDGEKMDDGMAFSSVSGYAERGNLPTLYRKDYPLPVTVGGLDEAHAAIVGRILSGQLDCRGETTMRPEPRVLIFVQGDTKGDSAHE